MEIVINGLTEEAIANATRVAIEVVCKYEGVTKMSAGNYGGNLGKYKIHLHELFK